MHVFPRDHYTLTLIVLSVQVLLIIIIIISTITTIENELNTLLNFLQEKGKA